MIGNADDIAGHGFVGQFAVVPEKEHRIGDGQVLAGPHVPELHAAPEGARGHAQERHAVAVVGVHVGLHLEHEARDLGLVRADGVRLGRLRPRLGRPGAERAEQFGHRHGLQRRAEDHRRQMAGAIGLEIELGIADARQFQRLERSLDHRVGGQRVIEQQFVRVLEFLQHRAGRRQDALAHQIDDALEIDALPERPDHRRHIERQRVGDLVEDSDRVLALAIDLVGEGDDRNVAQPAHFEQFQRLALDALGDVDHHDRRIDRRQCPVGILREVGVAGGIEQVEGQPLMLEGHHRGRNRNAALLLDFHPVRTRRALAGATAHRAGLLDRARGGKQLFGERGLAGVRVRNDRKGAARLVGQDFHRRGGFGQGVHAGFPFRRRPSAKKRVLPDLRRSGGPGGRVPTGRRQKERAASAAALSRFRDLVRSPGT